MNAVDYQLFECSSSHIILIIAPAMGVKQSFYKNFAKYLQSNGISVVTFDYSGIGNSLNGNIRDQKHSLSHWGSIDLESVIKYTMQKFPNQRKVIMGHSVGGQLIGLAPSSVNLDKIILISAQSGFWGFWNGFHKIKMFMNWYLLFPILIAFWGYMPSKNFSKMENLPKNVAKQWAKWCRSRNYLFDFFTNDEVYFSKIKCPLFAVSVNDDLLAPKGSVDWLTKKYLDADVRNLHIYPHKFDMKRIGHFGIFRESCKETIWKMLLNEIEN